MNKIIVTNTIIVNNTIVFIKFYNKMQILSFNASGFIIREDSFSNYCKF